ncbi:MAG TPA: TIGR03435 family protein [Candidatus Acidoferrales bacterium]|nr:TIGR03435 family protein [Candidatus Acidoferrales bacterium]
MNRAIGAAGLAVGMVVVTAGAAFGQSAATPLSFEVASIKPAAPPVDGRLMVRMGGDPGRLDYNNVSIKDLIRQAYGVKDYQISGPDWMASTRFDVVAKLPADTPRSKVPEMLQALLAERFKVTIHRETKELPMYALVVGKNGPKMKESEVDPNAPPPGGGPGPGGPSANGGPPMAGGGGGRSGDLPAVRMGKDGTPQFAPGPGRGPMMLMNGRGHLSAKMMNMDGLVNMLARQLDRPVVDQTGLKGNYDFDLDYTPDEGQRMGMPGMPPPPPGGGGTGGGGTGGGEAHVPSASNPEANGVSLFTAVQSQLGLKLDAKKGAVELIVVDRVEKIPTEN